MYKKIFLIFFLFIFLSGRVPDAAGYNGAVTSSSELATQTGIEILKAGGNAVDAAIAVGFALAVTHPAAGNLGGGGFMVIRLADGTVTTIDFREKAPAAASRDMFLDDNGDVIPGKSLETSWAAGVPGSVDGFGLAHQKYGLTPWRKLISPAIALAKKGFPLHFQDAERLNLKAEYLSRDTESRKIFTKPTPYGISDVLIQKDLGKTLKRISKEGPREFYEGTTGKMIVNCMRRTDGLITAADLKNYHAVEREPVSFDYRGYKIHTMPPASSGGVVLAEILNQLENLDLGSLSYHGADHLHYVVEAERRAYADRAYFLGDMDFVESPLDKLISKEYADLRWQDVDSLMATPSSSVTHGDLPFPYNESNETTHYSVVDKWGNAVSVTTTLNGWFGNGITVDGAGFLLNNEMDDFSAKPGVPNNFGLIGARANAIEPGKRMLSSMTPTIVETPGGDLFLVLGSPGGSTIITTVAQIISNVIDFGMNIEDAVEAPRFHHQWLPDYVGLEANSFSLETLQLLSKRGYQFYIRSSIGEANCIQIDTTTNLILVSGDSRRGGTASAW
ncbi:MAG: gamma-glutamyltransferase [FCB group bacterium]|nr:gamma-glutamyltransferase [FCB group bacterium]